MRGEADASAISRGAISHNYLDPVPERPFACLQASWIARFRGRPISRPLQTARHTRSTAEFPVCWYRGPSFGGRRELPESVVAADYRTRQLEPQLRDRSVPEPGSNRRSESRTIASRPSVVGLLNHVNVLGIAVNLDSGARQDLNLDPKLATRPRDRFVGDKKNKHPLLFAQPSELMFTLRALSAFA